jgi:hypothetical protein
MSRPSAAWVALVATLGLLFVTSPAWALPGVVSLAPPPPWLPDAPAAAKAPLPPLSSRLAEPHERSSHHGLDGPLAPRAPTLLLLRFEVLGR